MALTNIELYEALRKDLSEDSARMIAEVVPAAQDLATKADLLALELRLDERFRALEGRLAALERRMVVLVIVPLWGAVAAGIVKLFVR